MRKPILFAVLLLLSASPGHAGEVAAADRDAIHATIQNQIAAFRADDAAAAFGYAAPPIRSQFGNANAFMAMVRRAYQPVYRAGEVRFGLLTEADGKILQRVELTGPDGLPHTALYSVEKGVDGAWRISGCTLVKDFAA